MIDCDTIYLTDKIFPKGLYESFYFRGNDSDRETSFWLKHNFLKFHHDPFVLIECTMITFDRPLMRVNVIKRRKSIPQSEFVEITKSQNWNHFMFSFDNECFFEIQPERLRGKLCKDDRIAEWNFDVAYSHTSYFHFDRPWLYTGKLFPKKKLLTRDIRVQFKGALKTDEFDISTQFVGMNGHNWGKEHANQYAYANCNQFQEEASAYFDGYSGKILLPGGLRSPYLSGGSLFWQGQWFHFRSLGQICQHKVQQLTGTSWIVVYHNKDHQLEVIIDGEDQLWVELPYDHPDRKISLIRNTKFAKGTLSLTERKSQTTLTILTSDLFELETLT